MRTRRLLGEILHRGPEASLWATSTGPTSQRRGSSPTRSSGTGTRYRAPVPDPGDLGRFTPSGELSTLAGSTHRSRSAVTGSSWRRSSRSSARDRAVENAVVTAPQRDGVMQDLVGYVTLRLPGPDDDHVVLRERLHSLLRRRLPQYMVPTFLEVLDRFPLLAADKVDRRALPSPTSPPLGRRAGRHQAPSTPLESLLVAEWARILGASEVSVNDDFFCDLGGHSLSAARLVSSLRRKPQMAKLAIGDLYANPTIRGLAEFVSTRAEPAFSHIESSSPMPELLHQHEYGRVLGLRRGTGGDDRRMVALLESPRDGAALRHSDRAGRERHSRAARNKGPRHARRRRSMVDNRRRGVLVCLAARRTCSSSPSPSAESS